MPQAFELNSGIGVGPLTTLRPLMRGLTRRWIGPEALADALPTLPLHERIVHSRGLGGEGRAEEILRAPRLGLLHPPAEVPGVDAVALRLVDAVRAHKRIAVYGDYDADGVTALAVLWHVIRSADPECDIELFAPDRFEHGYGLNSDVLRQMQARGVQLVITVDCGITAVEPARVARQLGLELLITDHHSPEPRADGTVELPDVAAIAHPCLPGGPKAPFTELCGAAVAFKVASRFARHWCGGERVSEVMQKALARTVPLVALGTVADVVPLIDENRIFAAAGLSAMQNSGIPGIRALLDDAQLNEGRVVDAEHVAFRLAPRLNAIGRLGHAAQAVELLTTADPARARVIAAALAKHNEARKQIEHSIFTQACAMVEAKGLHKPSNRAIALAHHEWHEGVVGIVCSKLMERYGRPAVLLHLRDDGSAKGSGRSLEGFDLVTAVRACSTHLESCGGHAAAAGLTVKAGAWDLFAQDFTARCNDSIAVDDLVPTARFDAQAAIEEIGKESLKAMNVLRPYGRGNREPALLMRGIRVHTPPMLFGQTRAHVEVLVKSPLGPPIRAVWWGAEKQLSAISQTRTFDAIVRPKLDSWRGVERVQLDLADIAPVAD